MIIRKILLLSLLASSSLFSMDYQSTSSDQQKKAKYYFLKSVEDLKSHAFIPSEVDIDIIRYYFQNIFPLEEADSQREIYMGILREAIDGYYRCKLISLCSEENAAAALVEFLASCAFEKYNHLWAAYNDLTVKELKLLNDCLAIWIKKPLQEPLEKENSPRRLSESGEEKKKPLDSEKKDEDSFLSSNKTKLFGGVAALGIGALLYYFLSGDQKSEEKEQKDS